MLSKIHFNFIDGLDFVYQNINNTIIKEIYQYVINNDSWTRKIYQLSLSESAKKIIMNSWKENISSNEVYLNLRNRYKYLYSEVLDNMIRMECNNVLDISIKLRVEKNNNFLKKTPMELIYILYKEKISKLNKEFLINPDITLIQSFFDVEFNENDINIII